MSLSPAYSVTIDNLPHIAAAYSDGAAGRVLHDIWSRIEASLGSADWMCQPEPWGIALTPNDPHSRFTALEVEAALHAASLRPIAAPGNVMVIAALSCKQSRPSSGYVQITSHLDAAQYRLDMTACVLAYAALQARGLRFAEQPIAAAADGHDVLYYECLARLSDGEDSVIMPAAYMSSLERLGLSRVFDREVVRAVQAQLRLRPMVVLGCNISGRSAIDDVWWTSVLADLETDPDIARRLVIEITETARPESMAAASGFVQVLRRTGCRVALDDFGAGYSSIAFAREARADIVKIDGSFVRQRVAAPGTGHLLGHLIALARELSPQVVVEGVETEEDLRAAIDAGAQWFQGFYFRTFPPAPRTIAHPRRAAALPQDTGRILQ